MLFIYLAPFFVVLGARIFLPADRFHLPQWSGLALSFAGMHRRLRRADAGARSAPDHSAIVMMVGAAMFWAATTLLIKASRAHRVSSEKVMLYQLVVSAPMLALAACFAGEQITAHAVGAGARRARLSDLWVVSVTFVVWFALVVRYSANRLSAFTFLTPLFGVAAGHLVLGEPLTPAFAAAVALVAGGLVLVNARMIRVPGAARHEITRCSRTSKARTLRRSRISGAPLRCVVLRRVRDTRGWRPR